MRIYQVKLCTDYLDGAARDVRHVIHSFARRPAFVATAWTILSLGIGATSGVLSVVNRLILHPLPFANENRLVVFTTYNPRLGRGDVVNIADLSEWQRRMKAFDAIDALRSSSGMLEDQNHIVPASGATVSPTLFADLGAKAIRGRTLLATDDVPGSEHVLLLSDRFWRQVFDGRSDVVGQRMLLNDTSYTVVGIVSDQLDAIRMYQQTDYWAPLDREERQSAIRAKQGVQAIGRLRSGVTLERAQAELSVVSSDLAASSDAMGDVYRAVPRLMRPRALLDAGLVRGLWALLGGTLLVALLACANVANLQLVRAIERRAAIELQMALGASRSHIIRRLSIEGGLIAVGGVVGGTILAAILLRMVVLLHPASLTQLDLVGPDRRILLFSTLLVLATCASYTVLPAWYATSAQSTHFWSPMAAARSRHRGRTMSIVASVEIALSVVLLAVAGTLLSAFLRMNSVDPGFRPAGLVEMSLQLPRIRYPDSASRAAFWSTLLTRVRADPDILSVVPATPNMLLSVSGLMAADVQVEGSGSSVVPTRVTLSARRVPPDYFRTIGVRILAGQTFSEEDLRSQTTLVVIGQSMAHRFWPNASAVGRRFRLSSAEPWLTVKGVVGDVGLVGPPNHYNRLQMYFPAGDVRLSRARGLFTRGRSDVSDEAIGASLRRIVHTVDWRVPVLYVRSESDLLAAKLADSRFVTALMSAFAVIAVLLSCFGLYSVVAFGVATRKHEIGIRLALGACEHHVTQLVVRDAVRLTLWGLLAGAAVLAASLRLLRGLLYGISVADGRALLVVAAALTLVTLLASYLPIRQAIKVDPIVTLRAE